MQPLRTGRATESGTLKSPKVALWEVAVLQSQTTLLHIAKKTDLGSRVTPERLAEFLFFFFTLNTDMKVGP